MSINRHSGGGSNILRGGKRSYECGTLVGNFVEESHRPGVPRQAKGLSSAMYVTSTQDQMNHGAPRPAFGAGLQPSMNPRYDYGNIVGADRDASPSTWISLQRSTHANSATPTEFAAPRELKGHCPAPEELELIRTKWTKEKDGLKSQRFMTEAVFTQGSVVPDRFRHQLLFTPQHDDE
ncbi:hypothetical protein SPRG_15419 [Saprolegnia parasitica CBS 223.65]|uniref:Uncharacterized protein n=2 Tax=Saprolegnia parasitica (strain CBS 223.65) TaxID=695850 RepID=A0A067BLQ7_SAPPC|nr:hypothetical protein SPRG_15419 [Saprolegnia parasitica CBS 223.65]KDO19429.1 hypothetical protein SPRG_15419 [Saprolegnia parasitica CBS 223.65]|eukprot:XP_012209855.1 hypothetical protein SPRG_15419 [Saprolegnia parasitica CBS 223.65]